MQHRLRKNSLSQLSTESTVSFFQRFSKVRRLQEKPRDLFLLAAAASKHWVTVAIYIEFISNKHATEQTENNNTRAVDNGER